MFCPKCGAQVPDDAAFCEKCGNGFEGAPKAAPGNVRPAAAVSASILRTNGAGLAAAVLAVVAVIVSLMPWFDISSQMSMVSGAASGFASGVSSFFGGSESVGSSLSFEESYAVWGMVGLADTFEEYVAVYSSFGGSSGAQGAAVLVSIFSWVCLILWLVAVVLCVVGACMAFVKGAMGLLRAGGIFMIITVIVFFVFANAMGSDTGSANAMPVVCLVLSVVSMVCSFAAKKKEVAV